MLSYIQREFSEDKMAFIEFAHKRAPSKMASVHVHSHHELYYLAKGKSKYLIDDEIYPVEPGNVVFIPSGHYHRTDNEALMSVERYLISFDDSLFDSDTRILLDELMEKRLISIPINRIEGLEELFGALERSESQSEEIREAVKKIHVLSIISYITRHKREFTPAVSEADKIVHKISEYIGANYSDDLSLPMLSHKFGVSESHLSRKFKDVTGIGLGEYITFIRIMNAERLLSTGKTSITSVATQCGFADPNYFSTVFKKLKGVTPLKFSKSAYNKEN